MEERSMTPEPLSEWMRSKETLALLHIAPRTLTKLCEEGRIGVLAIPGITKKLYRRADVEALLAQAYRPATISASTTTQTGVLAGL
jgi:hypothetical protein